MKSGDPSDGLPLQCLLSFLPRGGPCPKVRFSRRAFIPRWLRPVTVLFIEGLHTQMYGCEHPALFVAQVTIPSVADGTMSVGLLLCKLLSSQGIQSARWSLDGKFQPPKGFSSRYLKLTVPLREASSGDTTILTGVAFTRTAYKETHAGTRLHKNFSSCTPSLEDLVVPLLSSFQLSAVELHLFPTTPLYP